MMYNLTQKGQTQDLTSGQGHDLTLGHVAYQPIPLDGLSTPVPLKSALIVSVNSY